MSFYATTLQHPTVDPGYSGTGTATAAWAALGGTRKYAQTGIWVKNEDDTNDLQVRDAGSTSGLTLIPGEARFFPIDETSRLEIARASGASGDVSYSYWAG